MGYPQVVYKLPEGTAKIAKTIAFPCFFNQKHLFSVDKSVYNVHKPCGKVKSVNHVYGIAFPVDRILPAGILAKGLYCKIIRRDRRGAFPCPGAFRRFPEDSGLPG